MRLVRREDWRSGLARFVERARSIPFEWGQHDCALFAAAAIEAMTGVDLASGWRGRYRSAAGAARLLRQAGHRDLPGLVASHLAPVSPLLAAVGDIAAITGQDGRPALGVVLGAQVAGPGDRGLMFVPRADVGATFHLPFDGEAV